MRHPTPREFPSGNNYTGRRQRTEEVVYKEDNKLITYGKFIEKEIPNH